MIFVHFRLENTWFQLRRITWTIRYWRHHACVALKQNSNETTTRTIKIHLHSSLMYFLRPIAYWRSHKTMTTCEKYRTHQVLKKISLNRRGPNVMLRGIRQSSMFLVSIIQGFRTIGFIFIIIFTTFRSICPPAFIRFYLSNSEVYTELRTTYFILSMGVICSDSVCYNRI